MSNVERDLGSLQAGQEDLERRISACEVTEGVQDAAINYLKADVATIANAVNNACLVDTKAKADRVPGLAETVENFERLRRIGYGVLIGVALAGASFGVGISKLVEKVASKLLEIGG